MRLKDEIKIGLISLIIFIGFMNPIQSQISYGVISGLNISTGIYKPYSLSNRIVARYHIGLFLEKEINEKFKVEPILNYSLKGWSLKSFSSSDGGSMNLHYVEFKILGKYSLGEKVNIAGGSGIGYLLRTKRRPTITTIFDDFYEKVELSGILGVDYKVSRLIRLYSRIEFGISNLLIRDELDINGNKIGVNKDGHNLSYQLGLAYNLKKG